MRQQERERGRFLKTNSNAIVEKTWGQVSALQLRAQIRLAVSYSRASDVLVKKHYNGLIETRPDASHNAWSL